MAVETVVWENLGRTLDRAMLFPFEKEQDRLQDIVRGAQGKVADLVNRDRIVALYDDTATLSDKVRHDLLKNLSTLAYKADDLLDEIVTSHGRRWLCQDRRERNVSEIPSRLVRQVCHAIIRTTHEVRLVFSPSYQFIYSKGMPRQVQKIMNDMEYLVRQLMDEPSSSYQPEQIGYGSLYEQIEYLDMVPEELDQHTMTGRRNDKNNIVKMLLEPQRSSKTNVSVICMTGLPGVGKSALAKNIYDDQKIKSHFDLRMWTQVSQITNEKDIIHGIVDSYTKRRFNYQDSKAHKIDRNPFRDILGCQTTSIKTRSINNGTFQNKFDAYNRRLRRDLKGKLYLLILDDVYLKEWQCLRDVLAEAAPGSRILITTRSAEVTDLVKQEFVESMVYVLQGLTKNHSWILFKRGALAEEAFWYQQMRQAGFEIIDICKYIPLTIKIAASFLRGKSREEWLSFTISLRLSRDKGKDIMEHVLHLSYSDLPHYLRACFVYCSLFPDDYTFNRRDLISLWIAQGFVMPLDSMGLEHVGEIYFMELSRRYFFEDVRTDDLGNILTCKMHHIMHKLASRFMTGVARIHVTDYGVIQIIDPTTKHASVNCRSDSSLKLSPLLCNAPSLRSLIFIKEPGCNIKMDNLTSTRLISAYRRLRVLDLHDLEVNELPESIGDQIHLRYLDLSKNHYLVTLPKSVSRLYNLQTLKLNLCPRLRRLDTDFELLVNLIRFEVDDCERLTCMPPGLEKLNQLETLSRFVVGETPSKDTAPVGLQALSRLHMLRGRLVIQFTGYLKTNNTKTTHALYTKANLVEVKIIWAQRTSDNEVPTDEEVSAHEVAMENLKPNEALKSLYIQGYKGHDFPNWANKQIISCLPNLVNISIEGCGNCQYLPPFGELKHLKKLTLRHMPNVQFVENTAFGNQEPEQERPFFPSLQELTLHNFYNLERWQPEVASIQQATRSFPCLSKLRIWNCPKLISFPSFTRVSDLDFENVNHLLFTNCTNTEPRHKIDVYTRSLQIKGCLDLKDFREVRQGLEGLPFLKHLVIDSCDKLTTLTYEVGQITSLERLEISNCKLLDFSEDSETPTGLQEEDHPWMNLESLSDLKFKELPKMETLPDCVQHVKSLKTMLISACPILSSLPEWMRSLTSLQYIQIESCLALKMLPKSLKEIRSLMKVDITDCPELQVIELCRVHKGDNWLQVLLRKSRGYGYA